MSRLLAPDLVQGAQQAVGHGGRPDGDPGPAGVEPGERVAAADGDALTRFEVVDGQQRLTTCFLLLDRIRRALELIDAEGAAEVAGRLRSTYGQLKVGGVDVPRLTLGADLQSFWKHSILGDQPVADPTLVAGAQRLRAAAEYFDQRIAAMTEGLAAEAAVERLMELQRRVISGLRFLVYEVQTDAEVGVVTSGALSPTLGVPIAMAYVAPRFAREGTRLEVDVRGTRLPFTVTALPFYRRKKS